MKSSSHAVRLTSRTSSEPHSRRRGTTGATLAIESLETRVLLAAELFFAATNGPSVDGRELWSYTGSGSPVRRSQIQAGGLDGNPQELSPYNGRIYFSADDGTSGRELYTFNGTSSV